MSTAKKIHHYRSYDPTGTTTLRDRFAGKMGARFRELARAVREAVEDDDVFALKPNPTRTLAVFQSPGKRAYQFQTDAQKITSFNEWLDLQVQEKIYNFRRGDLRPISGRTLRREQWTDYYIGSSYQDGIRDGSKNIHKLGTDVAKGPITDVFNAPVHRQRVENLYTRTFEQLKGVTADMSRDISTVLSDGLIQGRNAKDVGRALNKVITGKGGTLELTDSLGRRVPSMTRAKMIARTEIVRAHHMGNIQQIRSFGFDNVLIKAELLTAGDHRVCPECLALEARGPMPLDEAEKLIPVHPLCRCIVIPTRLQPKKLLRPVETIQPTPQTISLPNKGSVFDTRLSGDEVRKRIRKAMSKSTDDYASALRESTDYLKTISDETAEYIHSALYLELLPAMRSGAALTTKHRKVIKGMIKEMKPTSREYVTFRGIRDFNKVDGGKLDVGDIFSDDAFVSVTTNPRVAFRYADMRLAGDDFVGLSDDAALFEIRIPKGAQASVVGRLENQIVLSPNTKFRVTGVRKDFAFDEGFKVKRIYQLDVVDDAEFGRLKGCLGAGLKVNMEQEWNEVMLVVNAFCELDTPDWKKKSIFSPTHSKEVVEKHLTEGIKKAEYRKSHMALKGFVADEDLGKAAHAYTGKAHDEINSALRNSKLTGKISQQVKEIDKDMIALDESVIAYRGIRHPHLMPKGGEYAVGDVIEDAAYVSVSRNPRTAMAFANPTYDDTIVKAMFEIRLPRGAKTIITNEWEAELILARGSKFRVVGVKNNQTYKTFSGAARGIREIKYEKIYQLELIDDAALATTKKAATAAAKVVKKSTPKPAGKTIPKGVTKSQQARNSISELIEEGKYTRKEIVAKIEDDFGDAISRSTIDDQFLKIRDAAVAKKRFGKAVDVDSKTGVLKFT